MLAKSTKDEEEDKRIKILPYLSEKKMGSKTSSFLTDNMPVNASTIPMGYTNQTDMLNRSRGLLEHIDDLTKTGPERWISSLPKFLDWFRENVGTFFTESGLNPETETLNFAVVCHGAFIQKEFNITDEIDNNNVYVKPYIFNSIQKVEYGGNFDYPKDIKSYCPNTCRLDYIKCPSDQSTFTPSPVTTEALKQGSRFFTPKHWLKRQDIPFVPGDFSADNKLEGLKNIPNIIFILFTDKIENDYMMNKKKNRDLIMQAREYYPDVIRKLKEYHANALLSQENPDRNEGRPMEVPIGREILWVMEDPKTRGKLSGEEIHRIVQSPEVSQDYHIRISELRQTYRNYPDVIKKLREYNKKVLSLDQEPIPEILWFMEAPEERKILTAEQIHQYSQRPSILY
jgi:hypothetical protein